jgi:hypothetical protein
MQRYQKIQIAKNLHKALPKRKLELDDSQIQTLRNVGEVILAIAAVAGIVTVATVAPNALQLINKLPWAKKTYRNLLSKNRDQKKAIARAFYYIKQKSYVNLVAKGSDVQIKITSKGRKKIKLMNFNSLTVPKAKWDGKWWFVLADIPTKEYKHSADLLREKFKAMHFYPLQRTVWVYPSDPRDEVDFISSYYGIERFVTVLQASVVDFDDEKKLKSYFKNLNLI